VISRDSDYQAEGIEVVCSVEQALIAAGQVPEIMVIGGGAIYEHCLPKASRLYLTHIDASVEGDTPFPDYQRQGEWEKVKSDKYPKDENNSYDLEFAVYERIS
jgi:dihydrofolate reductase